MVLILVAVGVLLAGLVVFLAYKVWYRRNGDVLLEKYENYALGHAGSCIDCENQFVPKESWRGQPSKCFSCESDMLRRGGEDAVFGATKQKCFDC